MKKRIVRLASLLALISSLVSLTSCKLIFRPDGGVTDPPTPCEHQWNAWVYGLDPTCSEEGRRGRKCPKCNEFEYEAIPATENHYSRGWIIDKAATCETDGEKHKVCDHCGAEFARRVIPAAHKFVNDACEHCAVSVDDFFIFTYSDYYGYYIFTGMTKDAAKTVTDIILPATYQGTPVKVIDQKALYENLKIKSITVSEGYTTVREGAFAKCTNLTSAELPDSITEMGNGIFKDCISLLSANIPKPITKIPSFTFSSCKALPNNSVYIHEDVTEIGDCAFASCKGFTEIVIPDTVKILRTSAYSGCTNVKNVVVGRRVKRIERHVFDCGLSLTSVIMRDSEGWVLKAYYKDTGEPVDVPIKRSDLEMPFRAALYFKQTYVQYNWERD